MNYAFLAANRVLCEHYASPEQWSADVALAKGAGMIIQDIAAGPDEPAFSPTDAYVEALESHPPFTPGDWFVSADETVVQTTYGCDPSDPEILLGLVEDDWNAAFNRDSDEALANLRLAATAPALYFALKEFAEAVWSDSRLPEGVREDISALYHNEVVPTLNAPPNYPTHASALRKHPASSTGSPT